MILLPQSDSEVLNEELSDTSRIITTKYLNKNNLVYMIWSPHDVAIMNSINIEHAIKSTTFIEDILMSILMSEELYQAKARKKMLALEIEIHKGTAHYWLKSLCVIEKLKMLLAEAICMIQHHQASLFSAN